MLTLIMAVGFAQSSLTDLDYRLKKVESRLDALETKLGVVATQPVAFPEPMAQPVIQYAPQPTYYQAPPMQFYAPPPAFRPMRGGFFRRGGGSVCVGGNCG
jgi:hypothetical protein